MRMRTIRPHLAALVAVVVMLTFSGGACADPPSRVGRLGYIAGTVSFSPAGANDWVQATVNRPLTNGDRLWVDQGARAEIQVGAAMVRMSDGTSVSLSHLDDSLAQLQLTQGTLNVHARRLDPNQVFEIDTPNLAFTLHQPGDYRIEVDPVANATTIIVRNGQGEASGDGLAYVIDSRQAYRFTGMGVSDYQYVATPPLDDFDRWSNERDHAYSNSASARFVSPDVIGYQDLDANGAWLQDATYGNVWVPNRVPANWAPYQNGHWAWINPWGWTWIDDAPWGFAVSHYGRWAHLRGTWGWVPGPARVQAYYAPALVAFVGGNNFQLTIASGNVRGMAWFPLAPREVYRPPYQASRRYFEQVNNSNTVINTTVIRNTYNTTNVSNVVYANRQVPGAVIAVPRTAFEQSRPVSGATVHLPREALSKVPVTGVLPVAPSDHGVRSPASPGGKPPPARVFERPVIAHTAPPAPQVTTPASPLVILPKPQAPVTPRATKHESAPAIQLTEPRPQLAAPQARPTPPQQVRPVQAQVPNQRREPNPEAPPPVVKKPQQQQQPAQPVTEASPLVISPKPQTPIAQHLQHPPAVQQLPMMQNPPTKHESAPPIHQAEPRPQLAAPPTRPTPPPQPVPHLQPQVQNQKADANKPVESKKDREEPRHEEDKRRQKENAN